MKRERKQKENAQFWSGDNQDFVNKVMVKICLLQGKEKFICDGECSTPSFLKAYSIFTPLLLGDSGKQDKKTPIQKKKCTCKKRNTTIFSLLLNKILRQEGI